MKAFQNLLLALFLKKLLDFLLCHIHILNSLLGGVTQYRHLAIEGWLLPNGHQSQVQPFVTVLFLAGHLQFVLWLLPKGF